MSRVRFQLSETLVARGATCTRLWWPTSSPQQQMTQLVSEVLTAVGLSSVPVSTVKVTLSGFSVLLNSSTALLRDGDLLEVDSSGENTENKKRKQPEKGAAAVATTPAAKKSAATTDKDKSTPIINNGIAIAVSPTKTGPSRSARRKAAKRLRKRQGFAVQQKAAVPNGRFKATALAAVRQDNQKPQKKTSFSTSDTSSSSSSSSSESSSDSDSPSSGATSTDSDTSSSSPSSSTSEENGDERSRRIFKDLEDRMRRGTLETRATLKRDFDSYPLCNGMPEVGRVVAYKLLEIGEDYAPRISEPRYGKIVVADATHQTVIIQPYPSPSQHPLRPFDFSRDNPCSKEEEQEEEQEREPPPSNYDEAGILTAELAMFAELRYASFKTRNANTDSQVLTKNVEKKQAEKEETLPLGPTNYSRLGPPLPSQAALGGAEGAGMASPPVPVRDPQVLASLIEQLQKRRTEIASQSAAEKHIEDEKAAETEKTAASPAKESNGNNSQESKGNPRRRSALQSAVGPMLRMLRNSEDV